VKLDRTDRAILNLLQEDCRLTHQEIAERVGSSSSSVWRRIQALEEGGVIEARVALVSPASVGRRVSVICNVKLAHHNDRTRVAFEDMVSAAPEVMACFAVSGNHDYTLLVMVDDVEDYERFLTQRLLDSPLVDAASSSFTLRTVKRTTRIELQGG
jgi:Lrp/AsnC family transcriptional regulator